MLFEQWRRADNAAANASNKNSSEIWSLALERRKPFSASTFAIASVFAACAVSQSARQSAKALGGHAERTVELARHILKGDEASQFHNAVIIEMVSQALDHCIVDALVGSGYGLGVLQSAPLPLIEQATLAPVRERLDLLEARAALQ